MRDRLSVFISVAGGGLVSWAAWHHSGSLVALSILFPPVAMAQHRRVEVAAIAISYYGVASWPVVELTGGILPWVVATALLAAPWPILWHRDPGRLCWRLPAALALATVPPIGIVGWASPLTSAGVLFPGAGWIGVGLVIAAMLMLTVRATVPIIGLIVVAIIANGLYTPASAPGWIGIDTNFGSVVDVRDPGVEFHAMESIQAVALRAQGQVIVFPESVVRSWTATTDAFWEPSIGRLRADGKTVLVGATTPSGRSADEYLNVLVVKGAGEAGHFQQRIPVPVAMWKPWGGKGRVPLHLLGPATLEVAGERAAVLVCYEQLLPWTFLTALSRQPTVLVGVSNSHWTKDTVIPENQDTALRSWGRLFAKPVVSATNQ